MPRMSRMPLKSRMRHSLLRISLLLPVDRRPVGQVSGLGLIIELLLLYRVYSSATVPGTRVLSSGRRRRCRLLVLYCTLQAGVYVLFST